MTTDRLIQLLDDGATPLLRTDFSNDEAWAQLVVQVTAPVNFERDPDADAVDEGDEGYAPYVVPVDDSGFEGATGVSLASLGLPAGYVLLADEISMADRDDLSVLYVSIVGHRHQSFRCSAREVASIEANLSLANMDFEDFADNVDSDGVFRGFKAKGQEPTAETVPERAAGKAAGYAIATDITQSGPIPRDQDGTVQIEGTLTGTRRKLFPVLVRFCGLWGSDYTWSALGVPLAPGEILYANCFKPDGERGDPIPGVGGYILLRYLTVESPSTATIAWNWYKPRNGETFAVREHGVPVLAVDSIVSMAFSQSPRGSDVTSTTVKVTHQHLPNAWVNHMTAWWNWRLAVMEEYKVGLR